MKKVLLSLTAFTLSWGLSAQFDLNIEQGSVQEMRLPVQKNKVMTVNDTLFQPVFGTADSCDPRLYTYTSGGSPLVGTFDLGANGVVTDLAQILNLGGDAVSVESFLVFISNKEAGSTPGNFTMALHDTTGGIGNAVATTQAVSFANIDTSGNGINRFSFNNPVSVSAPFWAVLKVDNGSDSIHVYTTNDDCGGGGVSAFRLNDTSWNSFSASFSVAQGDPFDVSLWMWAEVDTTAGTIGLDPRVVHKQGLSFFPNPAQNKATVQFDMADQQEVSLYIQDMTGRTVYSSSMKTAEGNRFEVDLKGFEAGPYSYQIVGESRQLNGVFIKQ